MFVDKASIQENRQVVTERELVRRFESLANALILGKERKKVLLIVTRSYPDRFTATSPIVQTGECSSGVLHKAFNTFIFQITGESYTSILDIAMKEPDKTDKQEHYYDTLGSTFETSKGDLQLVADIKADDRGILSVTWAFQKPSKEQPRWKTLTKNTTTISH